MLLHRFSSRECKRVLSCRRFQSVCSAVRQASWFVRLHKYGSVSFAAGVTSTSTLLLLRLCFHVACTAGPALGSHHLSRLSDRLLCGESWLSMCKHCTSSPEGLCKMLAWHMVLACDIHFYRVFAHDRIVCTCPFSHLQGAAPSNAVSR